VGGFFFFASLAPGFGGWLVGIDTYLGSMPLMIRGMAGATLPYLAISYNNW